MSENASQGWVVGLDLSLSSTGIAALHRGSGELHVVRVKSTGKRSDTLSDNIERMRTLRSRIVAGVQSPEPVLVAVESMTFGTAKDTSAHRRSGLWWSVNEALYLLGIPVIEVPPSTLKKWATGKGNAGKDMVLAAGVKRWPDVVTQNDEADAAWLADIACFHSGGALVSSTKERIATTAKLPHPTHRLAEHAQADMRERNVAWYLESLAQFTHA